LVTVISFDVAASCRSHRNLILSAKTPALKKWGFSMLGKQWLFSMLRERFGIVMFTWGFFTVAMAAVATLGAQYIFSSQNALGITIWGHGELFVVSAVIAADAIGRSLRCSRLARCGIEHREEAGYAFISVCVCSLLLLIVAFYAGKVAEFQLDPTTQLSPYPLKSLAWFLATSLAAGVTVAGTEAQPLITELSAKVSVKL
jgi:hypothetical protein